MFGKEQLNGIPVSYLTFFSPIQGGIDPPYVCNVMIMYHYITVFMYTLLNVSKPECIRFEGVLESSE